MYLSFAVITNVVGFCFKMTGLELFLNHCINLQKVDFSGLSSYVSSYVVIYVDVVVSHCY